MTPIVFIFDNENFGEFIYAISIFMIFLWGCLDSRTEITRTKDIKISGVE